MLAKSWKYMRVEKSSAGGSCLSASSSKADFHSLHHCVLKKSKKVPMESVPVLMSSFCGKSYQKHSCEKHMQSQLGDTAIVW